MSPKCHLNMSELEVEYQWGKSNLDSHREMTVLQRTTKNTAKALDVDDSLFLDRVHRFAEHTREYRRYTLD